MMFNPYASPYLQPSVSGMQNFPQMQQMPQPPMGGPQQPMGNTQAAPAFLQVPSAKDFSSVTVQPGKQALIMAQNEPFLAFKNADMMGMVQTSIYRIEPVSEDQLTPVSPEYVTRKEFDQFVQSLTTKQTSRSARKDVSE